MLNIVVKIVKILIVFLIWEFFDWLNNGVIVVLIVLFFCLWNVKYVIVKVIIVYSDYGKSF